jgi:hypothetical protein
LARMDPRRPAARLTAMAVDLWWKNKGQLAGWITKQLSMKGHLHTYAKHEFRVARHD